MKKKIISLMLVAAMLSALVGCGKKDDDVNVHAEVAEESESTVPEVEVAQPPILEPNYTDYQSPYGWSLKYDPALFVVNPIGGTNNEVDFLYSGQAAGTTMVSFYMYDGKYPEDVIAEKTMGLNDQYEVTNADLFFGPAVVAQSKVPEGQESGLRQTLTAAAYAGGTLLIDATCHMSGDDAIDIPMNDAIAVLYDSLSLAGTAASSGDGGAVAGFASEDTSEYYGGLYANDGKSDMNLALFREDGNLTVLVQIGANFYYSKDFVTSDKELDDGTKYTAFSIEGKEFGYYFNDDMTGILIDDKGKSHSALEMAESAAMDMRLEAAVDDAPAPEDALNEDAEGAENADADTAQ
ncbi:MAG: hypothetical protein K6E84_01505 [Lachnospiraceae bacterium]|nr:hypothetical protein [Lachnospiraceae bacterium]